MRACLATLLLFLIASTAWAQQPPTPAPGQPVVRVERVESHWILEPEAKLTDLGGDLGNLIGFTAGWLREETFLVGGAGYWLTNDPSGWDLAYGGVVLGVQWNGDRRITFGARGLVGVGEATRAVRFGPVPFPIPGPMAFNQGYRGSQFPPNVYPIARDFQVRVSNTFLVWEPQANVLFAISNRIRFGLAAGYRLTSGAETFDDDLNGVTGTVSVQFGLGGK